MPPLRGLWPGLAAVKSMVAWAGRRPDPRRLADRKLTPERAALAAGDRRHPRPAAVDAGRPPARELRHSGRQIRRGAFGGRGGDARRPDRLPDGREGHVRRRAAPVRRRRGPARHQERSGPARSAGADREERPGKGPGRRHRWLRDAGRADRLRAGHGGLPGGAALWRADDRRLRRCPGRARGRQGAEPEPGDRRRSRRHAGGDPPRQDAGRLSQSDSPHRHGAACRAGVEPVGARRRLLRSRARMRSQPGPDPQGIGRRPRRRCPVRRGGRQVSEPPGRRSPTAGKSAARKRPCRRDLLVPGSPAIPAARAMVARNAARTTTRSQSLRSNGRTSRVDSGGRGTPGSARNAMPIAQARRIPTGLYRVGVGCRSNACHG